LFQAGNHAPVHMSFLQGLNCPGTSFIPEQSPFDQNRPRLP
jgi:hypothetical protein